MAIGKDEIVKAVEAMSALELMEMVKAIEERFGVSAMPLARATAEALAPEDEEGALFSVRLVSAGANRVSVIKAIREITGAGLKEAVDLVNAAAVVRRDQTKEQAEAIAAKLVAAGAEAAVVKSE